MSFKTKALGLAAATALSLSIVTGALADGSTTVKLNDGTAGCTGSIAAGTINFGTATWGGASYSTLSGANGTLTLSASSTQYTKPTCTVVLAAGDMAGQTAGNTDKILGTAIAFSGSGNQNATYMFTPSSNAYANQTVSATITLPNNVQPDTYNGDVTVSSSNAS